MASELPGWYAGAKNGKPWIWSQCKWVKSRLARIGSSNSRDHDSPNSRIPLPASNTIRVSPCRTSKHVVLPPYFSVRRPGVGIEPRVPQKRTVIPAMSSCLPRQMHCPVAPQTETDYGQSESNRQHVTHRKEWVRH